MKILLTTDGTLHSRDAVAWVARMIPAEQAQILLLAVYPGPFSGMNLLDPIVSGYEEQERELKEVATEWCLHAQTSLSERGHAVETRLLKGHAASVIIDTAAHENVDLVVLGSHTPHKKGNLFLGGVADRVVQHAPCSVLIVRTRTD